MVWHHLTGTLIRLVCIVDRIIDDEVLPPSVWPRPGAPCGAASCVPPRAEEPSCTELKLLYHSGIGRVREIFTISR